MKQTEFDPHFSKNAIDAAIKIAAIAIVASWSYQIIEPFLLPILWGGIIAIALFPLVKKISASLKISQGKASLLLCLIALAAILVPAFVFSGALFSSTQEVVTQLEQGSLHIPQPKASVSEWPVVGDSIYKFWHQAATNLEAFLTAYAPEIKQLALKTAGVIGSLGGTVLQFVISIIIAGVFMKSAESCNQVFNKVSARLVGEQGDDFISLAVATVRSVVQGVIGVAFIQALLAGIAMALAGVPGAGLLALLVLLLAIVQLPPILILGPVMAYVFSVESTTVAVLFMIWGIFVSASDAFLKPILMGRGVDIPMLIILLGALGGMMMSGIIGLFVGAVLLALGYKLFLSWLDALPVITPDKKTAPSESDG